MSHKNDNPNRAEKTEHERTTKINVTFPKPGSPSFQNDLMEKVEGGPASSIDAPESGGTGKPMTIQPEEKTTR